MWANPGASVTAASPLRAATYDVVRADRQIQKGVIGSADVEIGKACGRRDDRRIVQHRVRLPQSSR
jgi:hypothetical protein